MNTYVDRNVAHHGRVVRQPDVARLWMRWTHAAIDGSQPSGRGAGTRGRGGRVRVDDECALDIDLDAAGAVNGAVNLLGRRHGPESALWVRGRSGAGPVRSVDNGLLVV